MSAMEREALLQNRIAAEASEWFTRLQDAAVTEEQRAEFSLWLLRSPEHIREYLAVMHAWGEMRLVDEEEYSVDALTSAALADESGENVVRIGATPAAATPPAAHSSRRWFAVAASLAVVSAGVWFVATAWRASHDIETAVGEQRSLGLPDGSLLYLNTDSEVRVDYSGSERRIELQRGEARFTVARDAARPFIVLTDNARVRVLGTVFNVRKSAQQTAVAVLEGKVELTGGTAEPLQLTTGQRATLAATGDIRPDTGPPLQRALEWPERRLVFREETLAELVSEVNRYHKQPLRIADPSLAALRISGTFSANDVASLIEYLQNYHQVRALTNADGEQVLTRAAH